MGFRVNIEDKLKKNGLTVKGDALVTGGKLLTVQSLSFKKHDLIAGFTINFDNKNKIIFVEYDLQYCDHPTEEHDTKTCQDRIITPLLKKCCLDMLHTTLKRGDKITSESYTID